jgi:glycosyltransferase involved in cell wall biosynthesis
MRRPLSVVVFGEPGTEDSEDADWLFQGFVRDERLMNLYYNAADVFVLPSLADNLPNMLIESQSAGTPGVAFSVGGVGEIIEQNVTGVLVSAEDIAALAEGLGRVLQLTTHEWTAWSERCRQRALDRYSPALQAAKYRQLMEAMVARRLR